MITTDGIKRFFTRMYGMDHQGEFFLDLLVGAVPYSVVVMFLIVLLGNSIWAIILGSLAILFIQPVGRIIRHLILMAYQGVVALIVLIIPKDEEDAYQRRMARQEKKKKNLDTGEHTGLDYDLSAFGEDRYYVEEESPVQQNVK